jgi:hypothetical protein
MINSKFINLKCKSCNKSQEYIPNNEFVQALEPLWYSLSNKNNLLPTIPKVFLKYYIHLKPPLKLKTKNKFWSVYLYPNAIINGIETEEDIKSLRFCLCEIIDIIELNKNKAFVKIKIHKIIELKNDVYCKSPNFSWLKLLDDSMLLKRNGYFKNFKKYSYINIDVEGDLGLRVIVKKENKKSLIVAVNEWDFHLDLWSLCSIKLTQLDELNFGIKHYN